MVRSFVFWEQTFGMRHASIAAAAPEGDVNVNERLSNILTPVEQRVIAEIKGIRAAPDADIHRSLIENPAAIMYHFIVLTHGHVQLHLAKIARELGANMKTLQRSFLKQYKCSMRWCQIKTRLDYAKVLLRQSRSQKIAYVAAKLGYNEVRDFNHFFQKHTNQTPSEWMKNGHCPGTRSEVFEPESGAIRPAGPLPRMETESNSTKCSPPGPDWHGTAS